MVSTFENQNQAGGRQWAQERRWKDVRAHLRAGQDLPEAHWYGDLHALDVYWHAQGEGRCRIAGECSYNMCCDFVRRMVFSSSDGIAAVPSQDTRGSREVGERSELIPSCAVFPLTEGIARPRNTVWLRHWPYGMISRHSVHPFPYGHVLTHPISGSKAARLP